jgi:hypothetical protein
MPGTVSGAHRCLKTNYVNEGKYVPSSIECPALAMEEGEVSSSRLGFTENRFRVPTITSILSDEELKGCFGAPLHLAVRDWEL